MSEISQSQVKERPYWSHHSSDPGRYRGGHRCRPCAPVLGDIPILL